MHAALRRFGAICTFLMLALGAPAQGADKAKEELLVFAAASLTDVLNQIGPEYTKHTQQPVKFSFAASSALARQIEAGARADLFFSADLEWMDYLQQRNLIDKDTRRNLLGNRLVLIAPANSTATLTIGPNFGLAAALGRNRLATGDPDSVPVGRYAKSALTSLGVWNEIADRVVRADNVRSALAFVARGETPFGIVYETDAKVEKRVRVVDVFPASSHSPIIYPIAVTKTGRGGSREFIEFLASPAGQAMFAKFGFQPPPAR
jgi:molybdate transport system substrate-binding protein